MIDEDSADCAGDPGCARRSAAVDYSADPAQFFSNSPERETEHPVFSSEVGAENGKTDQLADRGGETQRKHAAAENKDGERVADDIRSCRKRRGHYSAGTVRVHHHVNGENPRHCVKRQAQYDRGKILLNQRAKGLVISGGA